MHTHTHITRTSDWTQLYPYTADLLCLDFCRQPAAAAAPMGYLIRTISTPLSVQEWSKALAMHPDQAFTRYIHRGLCFGFRIGFDRSSKLKSADTNMHSAFEHQQVVTEYLQKELSMGRMLGPFDEATCSALPQLQVNRFGVIPKGHNTGKWRLITDLSFPHGLSVNDGIDPEFCTLHYATVDDIAGIIARLPQGALLAKFDIESAYRLVPVHPDDRPLQAMCWKGQIYIDPMLPFGLRSAPKIFNAIADALNWHLQRAGIPLIKHYLDDYLIISHPDTASCKALIDVAYRECNRLGVPIAAHKSEGPSTCLIFLGIEINTVSGQLRLPDDKLHRLKSLLCDWKDRKHCERKQLESLIGLLNHACKVVRSGRSFLRRMIDLLHAVHHPPNSKIPIRLNKGFRSDLAWWNAFVQAWNGVSFLPPPAHLQQVDLYSDASGSWGCGAHCGNSWFQLAWDSSSQHLSITEKELIPIVLACAAWGDSWQNRRVICHCDNQAIVACLRSRTSRNSGIMHLLRCLVFVEARYHYHLQPIYIDTHSNHLADDLSRDKISSFLSKVPGVDRAPTRISHHLLAVLLDQEADWTSTPWLRQFTSTFNTDSPLLPTRPTKQQ